MTDLPTRTPPPGSPPGAGGLNKKLWGLPTWGWIAISAAAGIAIVVWMQSRKSKTPVTNSDDGTSGGSNESDVTDAQNAILAQLQDMQGDKSTPAATTTTLTAPTNIHFTSVSTSHAQVAWNPVTGAVSYKAEWQDRTGRAITTPYTAGTGHYYKLAKGDTVEVRVSGVDAAGIAGPSTSASTTIK